MMKSVQKENDPPDVDINDALSFSDDISLDDSNLETEGIADVTGTKKDVPDQDRQQRAIVKKSVNIPEALLPSEAFKKGVIISLPKGRALLRCVASEEDSNDENSVVYDSEPSHSAKYRNMETTTDKNPVTLPADNNDVVTLTPSSGNTMSSPSITQLPSEATGMEHQQSRWHESQHLPHGKSELTERFLKMFDKNMLVSLYKMAVKDILNEMHDQQKTRKRTKTLNSKIITLQTERSRLERQFPGISRSFIEARIPVNTSRFKSSTPASWS